MEIVFVRHGHAEHLNDYPNQLNLLHPGLTDYGKMQVDQLRTRIIVHRDDLMLVSPTRRTIETALLLTDYADFTVTPLVGPRMFPQNPEFPVLLCDTIYNKNDILSMYKHVKTLDVDADCWRSSINQMEMPLFEKCARQLLHWAKNNYERAFIISHDGTITNYRILLGEKGLAGEDFLGEAGLYKMKI